MSTMLEWASGCGWAMTPEACENLAAIAERATTAAPEVLEAFRASNIERGERVRDRDGVAILDVRGSLFKRANLFVAMSGATSYEILRRDLQVALDESTIHSILLLVDSPGGEANGCDELAAAIYEARKIKPITAFVSGMAASGGYWIASAASEIVISDAAMLGSIGVVMAVSDRSAREERDGVKTIEFTSSRAPGKRPDIKTKEGKGRVQKMVDDLEDVFIGAVARYRGVSVETVIEKFGAGGIEVGKNAVDLGMADRVGSFEGVIASLVKKGGNKGRNPTRPGGFTMSDQTNGPTAEAAAAAAAEAAATATKAAQTRIKTIVQSESGKAMASLAAHLAYDTDLSADAAAGILTAAKADFDAKPSASAEGQQQQQQEDGRASFADRKTEAGALGLGRPEASGGEQKDPMAGWGKAAANANASIGVK